MCVYIYVYKYMYVYICIHIYISMNVYCGWYEDKIGMRIRGLFFVL